MRRLALLCSVLGCAEWRMPPTFPEQAARQPIIHEQALLGFSGDGAAFVEYLEAEGAPPRLTLKAVQQDAPTRALLEAAPETARAVAERLHTAAARPEPALATAVALDWPAASARAAELGFLPTRPAPPQPGGALWQLHGAPGSGALPLLLRVATTSEAMVLLLSDRPAGEEVELVRMPLAGVPVRPELYLERDVAWLLAGSVDATAALHRTIGIRHASIRRGEAQLHNLHGLADYAAGELDAARREFDRAIAADPRYVDGLYNAAATAALSDRAEEAVAFLRRAAALDPARVQVLGRNDEDFKSLRRRADVRELLGLRRLPPEGLPPVP